MLADRLPRASGARTRWPHCVPPESARRQTPRRTWQPHGVVAWRVLLLGGLLGWLAPSGPGHAGDWPQILGPQRNGVAQDEQLADSWPADGPPVVWQRDVGRGLAGVAVVGQRVLVFHRQGNEEVLEALQAGSGRPLWRAAFPTRYVSGIVDDPRCVPTVHDGRVYVFGAGGGLHCVLLETGQVVWSRDTRRDFDAPEGYFGAGSSPLVVGDKLLVNVGGDRQGAGIVAFDLQSGETRWQSGNDQASYSSPVAVTIGGKTQAIFVTRLHCVAVDPDAGRELWRFPFGARGPTVNGANPVVRDGHLLLSAAYGVGAVYARLGDGQPQTLWRKHDILSSQYTTCVPADGCLVGVDGRHDTGGARLRGFDPQKPEVLWELERYGYATLLAADGKVLLQTTSGRLVLGTADRHGFRELANAQVLADGTFALPALADGRLYVRDKRQLKCLDLR